MSVNRVFPPQKSDLPESLKDKLERQLLKMSDRQRRRFYADYNHSLLFTGQAVVELAPPGPRVIDPQRIVVIQVMPPDTPQPHKPPEESPNGN